ncbi:MULTISPECIES: Tex family protein [Methanosphaera]|uniref:Tex family protein n=1 Tax=Methanosphaera TaxID=2316 RepID=UPI000DC260A6|nr:MULTISPECIES: Tex family protein [Methanosphaera]RAP47202.1 MAG: RNA-binding transcriptional accessory protein [Methanosphaera sp. DEW79]
MIDIEQVIANELNIKPWQANAAISLINEDNTIPFIARYRKEATGGLDDEILRKLNERLTYLQKLNERKRHILNSIEKQGKLTLDLENEINDVETLVELEDLYRPYKQKKTTRAAKAREKGLEKLALTIYDQKMDCSIDTEAQKYITDEVPTIEDAKQGANDIIADIISDKASFRRFIRDISIKKGKFIVESKNKEESSEYEMYYDYSENISDIPQHRILAINRGENENILKVKLEAPLKNIQYFLEDEVLINYSKTPEAMEYNKYTTEFIKKAIKDSYKRLIAPAIEREIRTILTDVAEDKSIKVFKKNLEQLLMQPPIRNKVVLGWDPAFRTGCKLAVIDEYGKVLDTSVVYPTQPQNKITETKDVVLKLIDKYNVDLIALGNGTASRESEKIIADIIKDTQVKYVIVNESGASVYSASNLAREEFPDYDVTERGAISIARRLQDPLAELVKIDPKSIGVGQYQHDMNAKKLDESLEGIVERSVNNVGVDLNTASATLMEHVAGVSSKIAKNIVEYRQTHGLFVDRNQLLKVPGIGAKTFEQCAGFMRIYSPKNVLDTTCVHPESYDTTLALLSIYGYDLDDVRNGGVNIEVDDIEKMANELDVGEWTLRDIIDELRKPGRDPREKLDAPQLRSDVIDIEDLEEGMILEGVVRNVVDFGAFVDIGVHQDGLVHISELIEDKFVRHPMDIVNVGDIVEVRVLSVDIERSRISLSMIL